VDEYLALNRAMWDERAPAHAASPDYGVERYVADPTHLSDVVSFDRHPVFNEMDGQHRVPRQEFIHQAFEIGREVLNDDECHPRRFGQALEKADKGIEPARGGANADHKGRPSNVCPGRRYHLRDLLTSGIV